MTNMDMLNNVENRFNEGMGLFPMQFKNSRSIYSKIDKLSKQINEMLREKESLIEKANETLEEEYLKTEKYRENHSFLSAYYTDERIEKLKEIGLCVLDNLNYKNSRAIRDHEGRWFATITDACEFHGVNYQTFIARRNRGCTLAECFSKKRVRNKRNA